MSSRGSRPGARCSSPRSAPAARSTGCRRRPPGRASRPARSAGSTVRSTAICARSRSSPRRRPTARARPGVRALAAMLADAGGVLTAANPGDARSPRSSKATGRRSTSSAFASARSTSSSPPCSSRPPSSGARSCSRSAPDRRCRRSPRPEQPCSTPRPIARGAALAYRRLGRQWLRIDLADRLASHAHKVRSAGGDEPVDGDAGHLRRPRRGGHRQADGGSRLHPRRRGLALARPPPPAAMNGAQPARTPLQSWPSSSGRRLRIDRLPASHPAGEKPHPRPGPDRDRLRRASTASGSRSRASRSTSEASSRCRCAAASGSSRCSPCRARRGPAREARSHYEEVEPEPGN